MDSLYIMRNLLILFCLMVVFWTNLGNCAGSCDRYTQCHYNETRMHSTVSCYFEIAGNTTHPCYGDGSKVNCSCYSENYQLSSPNNSYLCRPDKWEDGLYDLHCLTASPCDEPDPPDDLVFHSPDFAEGEMYANGTEIMYDCPDGFDLNGHMTAVCLYGVWTYEDAYCTALPCDEPAPPDGKVFHYPDFAQGEMYPNGTEILYYCPGGFDLNGNRIAVCLYGVWTYEDAICTGRCDSNTQCRYDEICMHSTVSCTIETAGDTSPPCYGAESIITCSCKSDKFQLSRPNNSYLCRPDRWQDGLYDLYCLPSPCDEPAPPDDKVSHSPDFAEGEMYPNGTEIMYDCPDGWDLNGHMTAVCLYGVWTYKNVYCTASPCDKPAPPGVWEPRSSDFAEREMYPNGTEIIYHCDDKNFDKGHRTAVCLYGEWTYEDTCLKATVPILLLIIIAIYTLLFAVLLIWLVKKHCLRRGTKWIPSVEGVANEQVPPTANDESKFVSKVIFEMRDPNAYQNDVNKEENDVTDHVGDNSPDDSPNNDPEEETV